MSDKIERARKSIEECGGVVSPHDIARAWGISSPSILERIRRGRFPEPVGKIGRVRVYLRDEVEPYRHGVPADAATKEAK